MPPVTRMYTTACVITTLAVQMEIVSPFQLYFNPLLIIRLFNMSPSTSRTGMEALNRTGRRSSCVLEPVRVLDQDQER